uniref:Innexin n=1 Tax=Anopheles atroparvus TaxID=41427 RepID=A0AAG5D7M5_ANOAO
MIEFVRPLQTLLKIKPVTSTDLVWQLHCRVTVYLLLFATLLLSAQQYFGKPIECVTGGGQVTASTMNDFCWIMGTYISKDPNFVLDSTDLVKISSKIGHIPEEERSYQKYYQWVVFILAIQAALFTLPNLLWKIWEAGRLQALCEGLTTPLLPDQWKQNSQKKLVAYLSNHCPQLYRSYVVRYCFCMLLNFCNVLLNISLVNTIFSGFWMNYQPAVRALLAFDFPAWNRYNSQVFPKLAKCDFHFIGPSGSKQNRDALCLLSLNVVNEKIFAFLWVWFIVLAVASALNLLFWMALLCSKSLRVWLLTSQLQLIRPAVVARALQSQGLGKWFLLYQLSRNLNPLVSRELVLSISRVNSNNLKTYRKPTGGDPDFFTIDATGEMLEEEEDEVDV